MLLTEGPRVTQYWCGKPTVPNSKWQRFFHIAKRYADYGWENSIVWSDLPDRDELWKPFVQIGCKIAIMPRPKKNFDVATVIRVYKFLKRGKYDIFHCHNVHTSPLIGAALARTPVRIWSKLAMSPYYEQGIKAKGLHRHQLSVKVSCFYLIEYWLFLGLCVTSC